MCLFKIEESDLIRKILDESVWQRLVMWVFHVSLLSTTRPRNLVLIAHSVVTLFIVKLGYEISSVFDGKKYKHLVFSALRIRLFRLNHFSIWRHVALIFSCNSAAVFPLTIMFVSSAYKIVVPCVIY